MVFNKGFKLFFNYKTQAHKKKGQTRNVLGLSKIWCLQQNLARILNGRVQVGEVSAGVGFI